MRTAGWVFIVIGALAFLGAASKGNSVFGPLFWIGIGGVLLYLKREREENKENSSGSVPSVKKESIKPIEKEMSMVTEPLEKTTSVTFEQKEAALCLIAFFAGYNDDLTTDGAAYMVSYQSAIWFGIVLTIKDTKSREFILLTCYDLTKMSGKAEAYEFLYNIANDMGYNKEKFQKLIDQYSDRPSIN